MNRRWELWDLRNSNITCFLNVQLRHLMFCDISFISVAMGNNRSVIKRQVARRVAMAKDIKKDRVYTACMYESCEDQQTQVKKEPTNSLLVSRNPNIRTAKPAFN